MRARQGFSSMIRLGIVWLNAIIVPLVLVGCASSHPGSAVSATQIFELGLGSAQTQSLDTADSLLMQQCMARSGFRYFLLPPGPTVTMPQGVLPLTVDISKLRTIGYGEYEIVVTSPKRGHQGPSPDPQNDAYYASLTPAMQHRYDTALGGGNTMTTVTEPDGQTIQFAAGGCNGYAMGQLYGSYKRYTEVYTYASNLQAEISHQAEWSHAWENAEGKWAVCMKQHGFSYGTEEVAENAIANRYYASGANIGAVHAYELRVANQDADCTVATKLNQVGIQSLQQALGSFTSSQINAVLSWEQMEQQAVQVASRVLAKG
jgi:hypothetical protein